MSGGYGSTSYFVIMTQKLLIQMHQMFSKVVCVLLFIATQFVIYEIIKLLP